MAAVDAPAAAGQPELPEEEEEASYEGMRYTKLHEAVVMALDRSLQSLSDEKFAECFSELSGEVNGDDMPRVRAYLLQTIRETVLAEFGAISGKYALREKLNRLDALTFSAAQEAAIQEGHGDTLTLADFGLPEVPALAPAVTLARNRVHAKVEEANRLRRANEKLAASNAVAAAQVATLTDMHAANVATIDATSARIDAAAKLVRAWQQDVAQKQHQELLQQQQQQQQQEQMQNALQQQQQQQQQTTATQTVGITGSVVPASPVVTTTTTPNAAAAAAAAAAPAAAAPVPAVPPPPVRIAPMHQPLVMMQPGGGPTGQNPLSFVPRQ